MGELEQQGAAGTEQDGGLAVDPADDGVGREGGCDPSS
jgi:hypothetical protein